jgi:hypothetical protein
MKLHRRATPETVWRGMEFPVYLLLLILEGSQDLHPCFRYARAAGGAMWNSPDGRPSPPSRSWGACGFTTGSTIQAC